MNSYSSGPNKKAFSALLNACKKLERVKGFEPSTHGLGSRYSTTELHPLETNRNKVKISCSDGLYYSSWGLKKQAVRRTLIRKNRGRAYGGVWLET